MYAVLVRLEFALRLSLIPRRAFPQGRSPGSFAGFGVVPFKAGGSEASGSQVITKGDQFFVLILRST